MSQSIVKALISFFCASILALSAWTLTEVTSQGKQAAAFAEAAVNLEQGYSIILRKLDNQQRDIQSNTIQVGRNLDKAQRNEKDIEKLTLSVTESNNRVIDRGVIK